MIATAAQLAANPWLRARVAAAIAALPRWTVPDVPPGQPDDATAPCEAPEAPEALERELAWLVLGLVADPEARAALVALAGGPTADQATALAAAERWLAAPQLAWIRDKTRLSATGTDATLAARLARLAPLAEAAALARAQPTSPPAPAPTRLTVAGLDAYLADPTRTEVTARGLRKARLAAGWYPPGTELATELDAELVRRGYDLVVIEDPVPAELDQLDDTRGFYLASGWIRYVTLARTAQEFVAGLDARTRSKLRPSAAFPPAVGPLTEEGFARWHAVYRDEVLAKPGAVELYPEDFAAGERANGSLPLWQSILFSDPATGEIVGGSIGGDYVERGVYSIGCAAYRQAFKKHKLSLRTFVAALDLAHARGWRLLSYGSDWNLYGYDTSLGLLDYKLSLALTPFPEGALELVKVLDPTKIATIVDGDGKRPGYFLFSIKPGCALWERYRVARAAGRTPRAQDLLGGPYLDPTCLRAEDTLVGNHFYGDAEVTARTPQGIEVIRRPMLGCGRARGT